MTKRLFLLFVVTLFVLLVAAFQTHAVPALHAASILGGRNTFQYAVLDAAAFPGSDPCAQTAAALASARGSGATISVPAGTCAETLNAAVAGVELYMAPGIHTFSGCPGINVSAGGVVIRGQSETVYQSTLGTQLKSGSACPLIANQVNSPHGADGTSLRDLDIECSKIGTFGFFAPASYDVKMDNVHFHHCNAANIFAIAGRGDFRNVVSDNGAGDCWVLGYDGHVYGLSQANNCGGDGIHIVSGGMALTKPTVYANGLHGISIDGNNGGNWHAQTDYVERRIICPSTNNPGNFCYYTQTVGTTAGSPPSFCQNGIGCTTNDGKVVWVNVGNALGYGIKGNREFPQPIWNILEGVNVSESGNANLPGSWCDIAIQGNVVKPAIQNDITAPIMRQSQVPDYPAYGICYSYASSSYLSGYQWYGNSSEGFSQNDKGALRIVNSSFITVDGMNTYHSYGSPIQLTASHGILFSKTVLQNTGASGHPVHAIIVDAGSSNVDFTSTLIDDNRKTPYSMGISNASSSKISFTNVNENGLANPPNSLGGPNSFGGAIVTNYIGGLPFAALGSFGNGSTVYCTDCNATCTAGGSKGRTCFRENGAWTH